MLDQMRSFAQSAALKTYAVLTRILAPLAYAKLKKSAALEPALLERQRERHGHVPRSGGELWIHAASVGEVHAVAELIRRLVASNADLGIVVSTVTVTGAERVAALFADLQSVRHVFAPLDTGPAVHRWLNHTRPEALLLVETELWPMMLHECAVRGVPVALINARLSARAAARYRRFQWLFAPAIRRIDPILCQSDQDRERWLSAGANEEKLEVTGNIKFDAPPIEFDPRVEDWLSRLGDRPVWVAGSTHEAEEPEIIAAHQFVLQSFPNALLLLVPRHPERVPAILNQLKSERVAVEAISGFQSQTTVAVVDQMGILASLYDIANACFVGGSLVRGIGGHNLLEPARAGRVVLTGPYTDDQRSAAQRLADADVLICVSDANTLASAVIKELNNRDGENVAGQRARDLVLAEAGALSTALSALHPWLEASRIQHAGKSWV